MNLIPKHARRALTFGCGMLAGLLGAPTTSAIADSTGADDNEPRNGEYRLTLFPYHRISDELTGFGYLGYVYNPDKEYQTAYLGYGASYSLTKSVQLWGGLKCSLQGNAE